MDEPDRNDGADCADGESGWDKHHVRSSPGQRTGLPLMFGAMIAFFAWGMGFHVFGAKFDFRSHPITQGGFLGWIVLGFYGLGAAAGGY